MSKDSGLIVVTHWWQLPTCIPGIVEECLPFLDQRILSEKVSSKLKFEPENVRTRAAFSGLSTNFSNVQRMDGRTDEWIWSGFGREQNEAFTVRVRPLALSNGKVV